MNPPPPTSHPASGACSRTARTSARVLRLTGEKLTPPFTLFRAVPSAPTTHTELPNWSTPKRSRVADKARGAQSVPLDVWSTVPALPTAHPCCASVNARALIVAPVPEVSGDQVPPAFTVLTRVPPAPAAYHTLSSTSATARNVGEPVTVVSVQWPPSSVLRRMAPPSPTTTIVLPRTATSRRDAFVGPSVPSIQLNPPSIERHTRPLSPTAMTSNPSFVATPRNPWADPVRGRATSPAATSHDATKRRCWRCRRMPQQPSGGWASRGWTASGRPGRDVCCVARRPPAGRPCATLAVSLQEAARRRNVDFATCSGGRPVRRSRRANLRHEPGPAKRPPLRD